MAKLLASGGLVLLALILGATVFREPVAWAAQAVDAHITNLDANGNIKVHEQGTANVAVQGTPTVNVANASLPVTPSYETQLLVNQSATNGDTLTVPVAAFKTVHLDFDLESGACAGSGAELRVVERTTLQFRGRILAADACSSDPPGLTLEMPGRSLDLFVIAPPGDTWHVDAFGRAN